MLIIFVLALKFIVTDGRVFCQDVNAGSWQAMGSPCQLTCSTIISAVDKLKMDDYRNLMNKKYRYEVNISDNDIYSLGHELREDNIFSRLTIQTNTRTHLKLYHTYDRLLKNNQFPNALRKQLWKMTQQYKNGSCASVKAKPPFFAKVLTYKGDCIRRTDKRNIILEKFTKFLNRYADPNFPFDEEITETILQRLEGNQNLTLRHFEEDYKKILSYLRDALRFHGSKTEGRNKIIHLHPNNCMNIFMPGCYCKKGYVERAGACMKPEDCMTPFAIPFSKMFTEYLDRIILH